MKKEVLKSFPLLDLTMVGFFIFFVFFILVVLWAYRSKSTSIYEEAKTIPFEDGANNVGSK
jgi:cbb3-type cytochrome oxidase subunit 3